MLVISLIVKARNNNTLCIGFENIVHFDRDKNPIAFEVNTWVVNLISEKLFGRFAYYFLASVRTFRFSVISCIARVPVISIFPTRFIKVLHRFLFSGFACSPCVQT